MSSTKMEIRVDFDDHIDGSEELMVRVEGVVEGSLDRFQGKIARVAVHLSRRTAHKAGERDMCCRMEAHAGSLAPIEVSHDALTLTEAIHAASAKLERAVRIALGRSRSEETVAEEGSAEGLGHLRSS